MLMITRRRTNLVAEQQAQVMALRWGPGPDGRFQLSLVVPVQVGQGPGKAPATLDVPFTTFVLSAEEKEGLKAALLGLVVSSGRNGVLH